MVEIKKPKKIVVVSIVILLLVASVITSICVYSNINGSYARTVGVEEESYTAALADFNMDFSLTYTSGGNTVTLSSGDLDAQQGVIRLTKEEYDTLKLKAVYTGPGKCYYRFKLTESWLHRETIGGDTVDIVTPKELSTYTFGTSIYDNRSYDGWIYYKNLVDGESLDNVKNVIAISGVSVGSDAADLLNGDHSNCVEISLELEAVQWNRAKEIWGLSKLPWQND